MSDFNVDERSVVSFFKRYNEGRRALSRQTLELIPNFQGRIEKLSETLNRLQARGVLVPIHEGGNGGHPQNYNMTTGGRAMLADPTL